MSKRFFSIVAIVAVFTIMFSTAAFAEMTMNVGAKGGLNLADVTGDDAPDDTSLRMGFLGGGFFDVFFNENFGVRAEVLYAMKGAKYDFDNGTTIEEHTLKLDYVEIPVLAVAQFPVSETFSVDVFAGPVFAFNTLAEDSNGETVDIKDDIASFELAGAFGVGGQFDMGSFMLLLEGRATIGFTDVPDFEDDPATTDFDESDQSLKNISYGIMVGVGVPLSQNGGM